MRNSIVLLDDDAAYCAEIKDYLELNGCTVNAIHTFEMLEATIEKESPDLLLLDKCLGNTTGTEILRQIRDRSDIPCMIITGHSDFLDRIVNLELGADDEVDKSLPARELLARIRTVLRRHKRSVIRRPSEGRAKYRSHNGQWRFAAAERELLRPDGTVCHLTSSEFETLRLLAEAAGNPVSRADLSERVFRRNLTPGDRAVDTVVRKIREKIRHASGPDVIKTLRHVGYVFIGFGTEAEH